MPEDIPTELAYDARQGYANLVNIHNEEYVRAKFNQDFFEWFRFLRYLKNFTYHNWSNKENALIKYKEICNKIEALANDERYKSTWRGESRKQDAVELFEEALGELEEFVQFQMKEGGVYGTKYEYDEDEI